MYDTTEVLKMATRKTGFWETDWFLGLTVSIAMLAAANSDLIGSLERKAYDLGVQASSRTPLDRVAVIAIDDASIANLGRWPWPRDRLAKMTDLLAEGKAKLVANTVFFFEPQIDPGYAYVTRLLELHGQLPVGAADMPEIEQIGNVLKEAEHALNTDRILAESMVVPAMSCCRCCLRWVNPAVGRTRRCPSL